MIAFAYGYAEMSVCELNLVLEVRRLLNSFLKEYV